MPDITIYYLKVKACTIEVEQVQEPDLLKQAVNTNSFQLNGLLPGKTYKFKVRSNCGVRHSDWSAWFIFSTASSIAPPSGSSNKNVIAAPVSLSIAPNPAVQGGAITLRFFGPAGQQASFNVMDISGKSVYQNSIFNMDGWVEDSLNIGSIPKGFYFVRAQSGGVGATAKLMVTE